MLDQAARLRELAAAYRAQAAPPPKTRQTQVIAVTSGKGGVGKSNVSVNLAHALTAAGKEAILLDADLGMANADILLGVVPPYHLGHLVTGEKEILDLICQTPHHLKLIAGGSGLDELTNLSEAELRPFLEGLSRLEGQADYLILDTGAGLSTTVQEFVHAADTVIVVTTPEPTALADAYGAIKAIARRNSAPEIRLIINQAERTDDANTTAERIIMTARDFLGVNIEHLGTIPRDPHVWQAVRRQVPFSVEFPTAPASRAMEILTRRLILGGSAERVYRARSGGFFERLAGLFGRKERDAV